MCDCCEMFHDGGGDRDVVRCSRHEKCSDCPDHEECPDADVALDRIMEQIREQDARIPDALPPVVCAWCGLVIREGTGPVSHGMCPSCYDIMDKEVPE